MKTKQKRKVNKGIYEYTSKLPDHYKKKQKKKKEKKIPNESMR